MPTAETEQATLRLSTCNQRMRAQQMAVLDYVIQTLVGFAVADAVYGWSESPHLVVGAGVASGLIGWETLKRIAAARLEARRE